MGRPRLSLDPETTGIWINGVDDLNCLVERAQNRIESELRALRNKINSFNYKTVKGQKYLYRWEDGKHIYIGKNDPRPTMEKDIIKLGEKQKQIGETLRTCVLRTIDEHLIIDLNKRPAPNGEHEIIQISGILELKK